MFDWKYLWYKTKLKKLIKTEIISKDIFDVVFRNSMNDNKQTLIFYANGSNEEHDNVCFLFNFYPAVFENDVTRSPI